MLLLQHLFRVHWSPLLPWNIPSSNFCLGDVSDDLCIAVNAKMTARLTDIPIPVSPGALHCVATHCVIDAINASFSNNSAGGNGGTAQGTDTGILEHRCSQAPTTCCGGLAPTLCAPQTSGANLHQTSGGLFASCLRNRKSSRSC